MAEVARERTSKIPIRFSPNGEVDFHELDVLVKKHTFSVDESVQIMRLVATAANDVPRKFLFGPKVDSYTKEWTVGGKTIELVLDKQTNKQTKPIKNASTSISKLCLLLLITY